MNWKRRYETVVLAVLIAVPTFLDEARAAVVVGADGRPIKIPAVVPKLSDTPGGTRWLGPRLGEHNAEVLERLGYSTDEQKALKERGVI